MRQYTQLTLEQRYQIYAFKKAGFNQTKIAKEVGVHKSTISRELRRNRGFRGYRPKQAHSKTVDRKSSAGKSVKLIPGLIAMIEGLIQRDFSPEQVCGYLRRHYGLQLSHKTIYQYILADNAGGGGLYKHLRHGLKKRKKLYGSRERRGQIPGRISIDKRPAVVNRKERVGDWEIDTLIGKNHKGVLLTAVERRSQYTVIKKVCRKEAEEVALATVKLLSRFKKNVLTVTSDNGKEFTQHQRISKQLRAQMYFGHPYRSWERGLNEQINGLMRQYFPKG